MRGHPNRARGQKANAYGNLFEEIFLRTCQLNGAAVTRIPDGCIQVSATKLIRTRTPWDWVVSYAGRTALIDTKTTQGKAFTSSMIKEHQVSSLLNHERLGTIAGYVVWLRECHETIFIPASALSQTLEDGGSFNEKHPDVIPLGNEMFDVKRIFT